LAPQICTLTELLQKCQREIEKVEKMEIPEQKSHYTREKEKEKEKKNAEEQEDQEDQYYSPCTDLTTAKSMIKSILGNYSQPWIGRSNAFLALIVMRGVHGTVTAKKTEKYDYYLNTNIKEKTEIYMKMLCLMSLTVTL